MHWTNFIRQCVIDKQDLGGGGGACFQKGLSDGLSVSLHINARTDHQQRAVAAVLEVGGSQPTLDLS